MVSSPQKTTKAPHPQIILFRPIWPYQTSRHNFMAPNDHVLCPSLSPHCKHANTPPFSLLSDSQPLPPLPVPPKSEKAAVVLLYLPSHPHSRCHHSVQLGGHKHRPKWLLFTCTICCSVLIPTILNLPTHSASPSIKWVPICKGRPQPSPTQPAYSALPDCIPILSPLSSPTPTPQPPLTSASLTCLFWHTQPPHTNLHIPTHIPTFSPLSILTPTPQPPSTADTSALTCVFRHAQPYPYLLSCFQSNTNASHSWLNVSAGHVWMQVGMLYHPAHRSFWLPCHCFKAMLCQFIIQFN